MRVLLVFVLQVNLHFSLASSVNNVRKVFCVILVYIDQRHKNVEKEMGRTIEGLIFS